MGEHNPWGTNPAKPNLLNYWAWPSVKGKGRAAEAGLLRYLKDNFTIKGAVGMRSGIMDMLALIGIPILSIDINPIAEQKGMPTGLRDSKKNPRDSKKNPKASGWDRGMKLEAALGTKYGRVFIQDDRVDEANPDLPNWKGTFTPGDVGRINEAVANFFGAHPTRDTSHPLHPAAIDRVLTTLGTLDEWTEGQREVFERLAEVISRRYSGLAATDIARFQYRIADLRSGGDGASTPSAPAAASSNNPSSSRGTTTSGVEVKHKPAPTAKAQNTTTTTTPSSGGGGMPLSSVSSLLSPSTASSPLSPATSRDTKKPSSSPMSYAKAAAKK